MKRRFDTIAFRSAAWSLVLSGGCLLGFAAQAADSPALRPSPNATTNVLTLDAAISLALDNNPELRASRGRIEAATGRDLLDTQRTAAEAPLAPQQKLLESNVAQAELEALCQPQTMSTPLSKPGTP